MKKNLVKILTIAIAICSGAVHVQAEPSYDDVAYWTKKCSRAVPKASDVQACKAFRSHLASKSED